MTGRLVSALSAFLVLAAAFSSAPGQVVVGAKAVDTWVTVTASAAGTDQKAHDEAVKQALRKAVEQACGVFLTAQSKAQDYQATYDKVFASAVGYVREHKVKRVWVENGVTYAEVTARVSAQKFEEDWAAIAHTKHQENNPRVLIIIAEATNWTTSGPAYQLLERGTVQSKIEDFFVSKGLQLVDSDQAIKTARRDLYLASVKDDPSELAAIGARFKADVVISGQASAKYGQKITMDSGNVKVDMHQYVGTLNVRAVRTDSAQLLVSKSFGPITCNTVAANSEDKALAKLGEDAAPKLLSAVVEAWRGQVNVTRNITIQITGMDYEKWKAFKAEVEKMRSIQALRLREITEGVANIDVEYEQSTEDLADRLTGLKDLKLSVVEITANRIKMKL